MNTAVIKREPVPYNRDAIAMIRRGCKASDLAWTQSFYERICRQFGVIPMPAETSAKPAETIATAAPISTAVKPPKPIATATVAIRDAQLQTILKEEWGRYEHRKFIFELTSLRGERRVERKGNKHVVNLFIMLAENFGEIVSSPQYSEVTGLAKTSSKRSVSAAAHDLCNLLAGTPLDIEIVHGYRGGYRLIYAGTKDPARVRIISIGNVKIETQIAETSANK